MNKKTWLSLIVAGAVLPLSGPATAQTPAAAPVKATAPAALTPVTTVEGIAEYRLPNGLQVLLAPDASKPTTTVNVVYHVGSRHEHYGETGMAHLLEHMVFKGTPTTRNALGEFTRRGFRANGSTSWDRTNYFASFAADDANLEWFLSWHADIMVNSFIAKADLDSEMTVVRNEFEMGENSPGRVLFQRLLAGMFEWHNYGKTPIGARSDIENVDISRLQAFYRKHYQPDNATLVVTGKFDPAQVLAWTQKYFGAIPRPQRVLEPTYTLEPVQDGERVLHVRRVGGTPLMYQGYKVVAGSHPDYAALELLVQVLGDTPNGRLHKALVEKGLATGAFAQAMALAEPGLVVMGASLAPGQALAPAREALQTALAELATRPITAEELERARRSWLNQWEKTFADPEAIGTGLSEDIALGDWRLAFLTRDRIRKASLEDVRRVAATYLRPDNRTLAMYEPTEQPQRAPELGRVDVAAALKGYQGDAQVQAAEAFDPTPANLQARTQRSTVGGLSVALLPKGTRGQEVQARLRLRYGSAESLQGLTTAADFTAAMLDMGGAGLTRQQIADELERLKAQVRFDADGQVLSVAISTKRDQLPAVIELVGRLLRQPGFEAAPLEELKRQQLSAIENARQQPDGRIALRLQRHGNPYPAGDVRYVPTFDEQVALIRAVTPEALKDFHRRFYSAAQGEFAAVGDLDAAAVQQALQRAFGGWTQPAAGPMPFARVPRPLVPLQPERIVERTPDKANANLLGQLHLKLQDDDADRTALTVADFLFGGGASSRLWQRIREKDGLSYDVRSGLNLNPMEPHSVWQYSAIFAPQNQPKVEAAFTEELQRSLRDGFTPEELAQGKKALLNYRQLARAQDGVVAGRLVNDLYLKRTFERMQRDDEAIAAVTLDEVNAAWRKYIRPDALVSAWGGDFKTP